MNKTPLVVGAAIALCASGALAAPAPQGFPLSQTQAATPYNFGAGVVAGRGGVLYGTLGSTLYALAPPAAGGSAWSSSVLGQSWTTGAVADGFDFAEGKVALDAQGAIYAATARGLERGGSVIKFTPPAAGKTAWSKSVLWAFTAGAAGASVNGGLLVDASGAVYGTTRGGSTLACAPACGFGSVFKLTPPSGQAGWKPSILYTFTGGADGERPDGALSIDASGALYGTAAGGASGEGMVFRLAPGSGQGPWTKTTLHSFTGGADGGVPTGGVVADSTGNLYGLSAGCIGTGPCNVVGSVYRLAKPALAGGTWALATVAAPAAVPAYLGNLLLDRNGTLYGAGGYQCSSLGIECGVVFSLAPPALGSSNWTYTQLYDLAQAGSPRALVASNGVLYGTANEGAGCATAAGGCMTVFAVTGAGFAQ